MKKLAVLLALMIPLMGAKCSSQSVEEQIKQVQAQAEKICGFLPTASSVAQMIVAAASGVAPGGIVIVTGVSGIAHAICSSVASVNPQAHALVGNCSHGTVNGVCVEGSFTEDNKLKDKN